MRFCHVKLSYEPPTHVFSFNWKNMFFLLTGKRIYSRNTRVVADLESNITCLFKTIFHKIHWHGFIHI